MAPTMMTARGPDGVVMTITKEKPMKQEKPKKQEQPKKQTLQSFLNSSKIPKNLVVKTEGRQRQ
jgi:hypothetical protein